MKFKFAFLFILLFIIPANAKNITCTVAATCDAGYTDIFHISSTTNAHGELPSQSSYANRVCCTYDNGALGTSCSGNFTSALNLSGATNAHGEQNDRGNYANGVCINATRANLSVDYATSCFPDGGCIASMSAAANAHLGDCNAYSSLVCGYFQNLSLTITQGNGSTAGTAGFGGIPLTINFFDTIQRIYPNNVSGTIWVELSPGAWDSGHNCTTNSQGNCTVEFIPNCDYTDGRHLFRGGPYRDDMYDNRNSTNGELAIDISAFCLDSVTLSLEFNISGNSGDVGRVGTTESQGFFSYSQISDPYVCLEDPGITNTPTFGIIFAGRSMNYINLTPGNSFVMKVSQRLAGNKFILPVTRNGCSSISTNMGTIRSGGFMPHAFVSFTDALRNIIEIALSYPEIDILGDFSRSGTFTINLEKIETNITQINITEG